jgi:hypothetical protein
MKWEYTTVVMGTGGLFGGKVDKHAMTAKLNEYGAKEWELVSVFDTNRSEGATRDVVAVFKRQCD